MKIDFGRGMYLEPDEGPRDSPFHKRITKVIPMPDSRSGNTIHLECGHRAMTFGDLKLTDGVVLCTECRDKGTR
jgi:hypothetical protein